MWCNAAAAGELNILQDETRTIQQESRRFWFWFWKCELSLLMLFSSCRSFLSLLSGLDHWRTFKHSNWTLTAANGLPPLSLVSGRVSDDPASSDWLAGSRQARDGGWGDSASFLMSSLISWTEASVTSLSGRRGSVSRLQDPKQMLRISASGTGEGSVGSTRIICLLPFLLEPQQGALFGGTICWSAALIISQSSFNF